ncbi:hypothetical protein [Streptomyces sp. A1547]|uniref:hypothetical protein n=1 Tax=Streptomyces sp. A1547 TaxID=2563105 RepID=UPI00109E8EF6|nr:hypothetical protein [Streptomyces sp. A1547]THA33278.1 hypothetical protein E6W17_31945 [Streptomyces sp. A1547]
MGLDGLAKSPTESLVQVGVHAINAGVDTLEQPIGMVVQAEDRMSASVVRSTGIVYSPSPATIDSGGYSNSSVTSHQG